MHIVGNIKNTLDYGLTYSHDADLSPHAFVDADYGDYSILRLIRGDNHGTIALTKSTKDHGKVKHIDIRHHYIRELLQSGAITIEQVSSSDNFADLFTKSLLHDHPIIY